MTQTLRRRKRLEQEEQQLQMNSLHVVRCPWSVAEGSAVVVREEAIQQKQLWRQESLKTCRTESAVSELYVQESKI
jgi:hypothetical protein